MNTFAGTVFKNNIITLKAEYHFNSVLQKELLNSMATIKPGDEPDDDGGGTAGGNGNLE
jgi:hypothetical protein